MVVEFLLSHRSPDLELEMPAIWKHQAAQVKRASNRNLLSAAKGPGRGILSRLLDNSSLLPAKPHRKNLALLSPRPFCRLGAECGAQIQASKAMYEDALIPRLQRRQREAKKGLRTLTQNRPVAGPTRVLLEPTLGVELPLSLAVTGRPLEGQEREAEEKGCLVFCLYSPSLPGRCQRVAKQKCKDGL